MNTSCKSRDAMRATNERNDQPLNEHVTTMPAEVLSVNPITTPVWIRLPKIGKQCPFTGLSRSTLNALILGVNPPVRSVSLRKRHAMRGTRLILLSSLLDHIERVAAIDHSNSAPLRGRGGLVEGSSQ